MNKPQTMFIKIVKSVLPLLGAGLFATGCQTYNHQNHVIAYWEQGNLPAAEADRIFAEAEYARAGQLIGSGAGTALCALGGVASTCIGIPATPSEPIAFAASFAPPYDALNSVRPVASTDK